MLHKVTSRMIDFVTALLLLVLLAPVILVIGILVRLSSQGPIFFRQHRKRPDGSIKTVFKFRTMFVYNQTPARQASVRDARITPIGYFLRRTSLDELPQFLSILQGNDTLSNHRPESLFEVVVFDLIRTRILYAFCLIGGAGLYFKLRSQPDYIVLSLCATFALGLLLDTVVALYRLQTQYYGTSALELNELKQYLLAHCETHGGNGGDSERIQLYPERDHEDSTASSGSPVWG